MCFSLNFWKEFLLLSNLNLPSYGLNMISLFSPQWRGNQSTQQLTSSIPCLPSEFLGRVTSASHSLGAGTQSMAAEWVCTQVSLESAEELVVAIDSDHFLFSLPWGPHCTPPGWAATEGFILWLYVRVFLCSKLLAPESSSLSFSYWANLLLIPK